MKIFIHLFIYSFIQILFLCYLFIYLLFFVLASQILQSVFLFGNMEMATLVYR